MARSRSSPTSATASYGSADGELLKIRPLHCVGPHHDDSPELSSSAIASRSRSTRSGPSSPPSSARASAYAAGGPASPLSTHASARRRPDGLATSGPDLTTFERSGGWSRPSRASEQNGPAEAGRISRIASRFGSERRTHLLHPTSRVSSVRKSRLSECPHRPTPRLPMKASRKTPGSGSPWCEGRAPDAADRCRPGRPAGRRPGAPKSAAGPPMKSEEPPPMVPSQSRWLTVSTPSSTT